MRRLAAILLLLAAAASRAEPRARDSGPARQDAAPTIVLRAAPVTKEVEIGMRRWHRAYREWIRPVRREWGDVVRAARSPWAAESLEAGCRRLAVELGALERRRLPVAPDLSVSLYLDGSLRALSEASGSCTRGAYFLTEWRLRQAAESWAELRGRLAIYGLAP